MPGPRRLRLGLVAAFAAAAPTTPAPSPGATLQLFVSPNGSDAGDGSAAHPFATLRRAQQALRGHPGSNVTIAAGVYANTTGPVLELGPGDSGRPGAPIVYACEQGAVVTLSSGFTVPSHAVKRLSLDVGGPAANGSCSAPPASARARVWTVDLGALGLADFGSISADPGSAMELSVGESPMLLARHPNVNQTDRRLWRWMRAAAGSNDTLTVASNDSARVAQWVGAHEPWAHYYPKYDWSDSISPIVGVSLASQSLTVGGRPPHYGWAKGARWLAFNLLCELDDASEYYIDRAASTLYFIPPTTSFDPAFDPVTLSSADTTVRMRGVHDVSLVGLRMAHARQAALNATAVSGITLNYCKFRNSGGAGLVFNTTGGAGEPRNLSVLGLPCGTNPITGQKVNYSSCIMNSELSGIGGTAATVSAGEVTSLTPGHALFLNNIVHDYSRFKRTYQPGVQWAGVNNTFSFNTFFDAPHQAFLGDGNDCIFEHNFVSDLGFETADAGAWYAGRDWVHRNNVIRFNHFRNIRQHEVMNEAASSCGVYFDDQLSGNRVYNNSFIDVNLGVLLGGGRHNLVYNNTFRGCDRAVSLDNRGLTWQKQYCQANGTFQHQLAALHYRQPPWSTHYPPCEHSNLTSCIPGGIAAIMDHLPCSPVGNVVANNTACPPAGGAASASFPNISAWPAGWGNQVARNAIATAADLGVAAC